MVSEHKENVKRVNMKRNGFTLIELMVVVAIILILGSIILPSYKNYTIRGNRSDGIGTLQNLLDAQERYYADNMEYTTDLTNLGASSTTISSPREYYKIKAQQCTGATLSQCVELYATGQNGQEKDGDLIFNTAGKQVLKNTSGTEVDL